MKYFTIKQSFFIYSFDIYEKELKKIDKLLQLLENSNVGEIIDKALKSKSDLGRNYINPYNMFAVIVYSFSIKKSSLRDIENNCYLHLGCRYIMDNICPTYVTFSNYINNIILPNINEIMSSIVKALINEMNIDISDIFIDGSKFEANANKYKFVWKPSSKQVKLTEKIKDSMKIFELLSSSKVIKTQELTQIIEKIRRILVDKKIDYNNVIIGRGIKIKPEQKIIFY